MRPSLERAALFLMKRLEAIAAHRERGRQTASGDWLRVWPARLMAYQTLRASARRAALEAASAAALRNPAPLPPGLHVEHLVGLAERLRPHREGLVSIDGDEAKGSADEIRHWLEERGAPGTHARRVAQLRDLGYQVGGPELLGARPASNLSVQTRERIRLGRAVLFDHGGFGPVKP